VSAPTVSVENLTRRFKRRAETVYALDTVSLELFPGQLVVAAGPSGSGKTTLLSILAGLEPFDAGRIITYSPLPADVPLGRMRWRDVAFVPQVPTLLDELTTRENIEMPALLKDDDEDLPVDEHPGWEPEQLMELLEIEHLAERYPSLTSGGEQQRTAIGRALRLRPRLLLADEPTGHQDRERVELVLGLLRRHAYAGNTVLISSHDQRVIDGADRVLRLRDGKLE
jgi:putative ABC transport system ATP-binding protein